MTTAGRPLRSLRRRYHALLALRWIPSGLSLTVFVLLMRERGLTLAEVGVGTAAQGLVMLVLELPSGGLADARGRKPVLVVAAVLGLAATGILLTATSVGVLALSFTIQGVSRALDSGPLQSWFVDEALAADPETDIERDLSRADIVISAGLGAGALLASAIVRAGGAFGLDPLVAPIVVSLLVQAASLLAVVALMHEHREIIGDPRRTSVGGVGTVLSEAVAEIRASRLLLALVLAELLWGFGGVAFESLFPARLSEVAGGGDPAAGLVGPALTAAWALSAIGAATAPLVSRRLGPGPAGCGLRVLQGTAVVGMGVAAGPAGVITAYLVNYGAHGATNPVHYGMIHQASDSAHRATVISANSLSSQLGFAGGGILLGVLADRTSVSTAIVVAGVVLAAAAPLYLTSPDAPTRFGHADARTPARSGDRSGPLRRAVSRCRSGRPGRAAATTRS
jgi:MFS family permease